MIKIKRSKMVPVLALLVMGACSSPTNKTDRGEEREGKGNESDWQQLIQDNSTAGWHSYLGDSTTGWEVQDGVLFTFGNNGDIVTDEVYENFELSLEWMIEEQGNSGVFYHVDEKPENERIHMTGPEFQIIDDSNYPQELTDEQKTGALSDVIAPAVAAANPVGEWNETKIIVNSSAVEHWLNGEKILEYRLNSEDLKEQIANSKFESLPNFAKAGRGRIGLQDHGDPVYYKNVKIKKL